MLTAVLEHSLRLHGGLGQRVLVAVSGGADSVALLRACVDISARCELSLVAGHFDHGLRGPQSTADAAWVAELAQRLGINCQVGRADASEPRSGTGVEERARDRRYAFLRQVAEHEGCPVVLTAHTADDLAETVLHHLIRGTGWAGLCGIPAERPLTESIRLVRPLLAVSRENVLAYLSGLGQEFRVDSSNADVSLTRNSLRREILPLLRERFNPRVSEALCSLSELAAETDACLAELSERFLAEALLESAPDRVTLDLERLRSSPELLLRELLRRLWVRQGWPRQGLGRKQLQRMAESIRAGGMVDAFDLPGGVRVSGRGGVLQLQRNAGKPAGSGVENP